MESHLTELKHLAENRAVFPNIKDLHLLHHLVLQKRTGQGVTALNHAQGYSYDEADEAAAASASTIPCYQGPHFAGNQYSPPHGILSCLQLMPDEGGISADTLPVHYEAWHRQFIYSFNFSKWTTKVVHIRA